MRYWIGPWVWDVLSMPSPHWRAPKDVVGAIDLRPLPAQGTAVIASGIGFFATDDLTDLGLLGSYTLIGQGDLRSLTTIAKDRSNFAAALGLATLNGATLVECLWDALTLQARPTGDTGPKPIIPTTTRNLELHLGGHSLVMTKPFDLAMPEAANVKLCLQEDYRVVANAVTAGKTSDPQLNQKVLGFWGVKYGVPDPQNYFIPADMVKVAPVAPTTTISDDFTRADGTTIGNLLTWTEVAGDWQTLTNQIVLATTPAADGYARAETDLSSADHYGQISVVALGAGTDTKALGGVARFAAAASTFYTGWAYQSDDNYYLSKVVTGTRTNLGNTAITRSLPEPYKTECNGTTITAYQNGVSRVSLTDSAISGNTRAGFFGVTDSANGVTLDDFQAADLAAAGGPFPMFTPPALDGIGSYGRFMGNRPS